MKYYFSKYCKIKLYKIEKLTKKFKISNWGKMDKRYFYAILYRGGYCRESHHFSKVFKLNSLTNRKNLAKI